MGVSYLSICLFALLINRVSLQVVGFIGDDVVLPCNSSDIDHKHSDITVYWRHNGSLNVYDIINGKSSVQDQSPRYKNRAKIVSENYEKGNFNITLSSLSHTDAGEYQCFVTHSNELLKVQLLIKESTVDKRAKEQAKERLLWMRILIPTFFVLVMLCFSVICIAFRWKKKKNEKNCSVLSAPESFRLQTNILEQ